MNIYRAELHVHTVLSPCAEIEMLPPLIIQAAVENDIQILAITDHNATGNINSVMQAAVGSGITVFPGMELHTKEEIHALCLFDSLDQASKFQIFVDAYLPPHQNSPEFFGIQLVVDESGDLIREDNRLLSTATHLSLSAAEQKVNELGGLFIPAHVNRKAFGLIETLGFVPDDLQVDVLEISSHLNPEQARFRYPQISRFPLIQSGDAHRLDEILGLNQFHMEKASITEIKKAIQGIEGRSLTILEKT